MIDVITLAFAADPIARWATPDPVRYLAGMPAVVRAFGGNGFAHGSVHLAADGGGAAMWLPPGVEPDGERLEALAMENAPEERRADLARAVRAHGRVASARATLVFAADRRRPGATGPGDRRRRCCGTRLPGSMPRGCPPISNRAIRATSTLYRRHGFEPLGTIQVGSSPPVVPMLRRPR